MKKKQAPKGTLVGVRESVTASITCTVQNMGTTPNKKEGVDPLEDLATESVSLRDELEKSNSLPKYMTVASIIQQDTIHSMEEQIDPKTRKPYLLKKHQKDTVRTLGLDD